MSDDVDKCNETSLIIEDAKIREIRRKACIDPGVPGECDRCGENSLRLIFGYCAPCRDKYKLDGTRTI